MSDKRYVVLSEPLDSQSRGELEAVARVVPMNPAITESELIDLVQEADAIIERKVTITGAAIRNAPKLKVIARMGVGVDKTKVDTEEAARRGIPISFTEGINSEAVAEHTFALLLALARRIVPGSEAIHEGDRDYFRDPDARKELEGVELLGRTLGIVGVGHIGKRVAEIAKTFGMNVLAYDPYVTAVAAAQMGVTLTTLPDLLSRADVVSLHLPLNKETESILNAESLGLMKKTALLVNTSRGGVIDEAALADFLKRGAIAGAALDVYRNEPIEASSPLLRLRNVILTPHVAGNTQENFRRSCKAAADEVLRVLKGLKPLNAVKYSPPQSA